MKICILSTSTTLHQMGGTEVHAETLAAEAARQGHEVTLLTTAHPEGKTEERAGGYTTVYLQGTHYSMSRAWEKEWRVASTAALSRLRAEGRLDIVWAENLAGLAYAALPSDGRVPVISIVNGLGLRGELASNFNRVSTVGELIYFSTRYAAQFLLCYLPWFRAVVRGSDLLVGVSYQSSEAVTQEFPSAKGKTITILNPVDTGAFRPDPELRRRARAELGFADADFVTLMTGVVHKQKGMHLGMEAFAGLAAADSRARLLIVGDGPQRAELEKAAAAPELAGRVKFCGMKPNSEMPLYYNAADLYLNPTLRLEGLAIVILEAMSCGLPCVVSRIGGTASSIDDGVSGFFTRPGDLSGIELRLKEIAADQELAKSLGNEARRRAVDVFDKVAAIRQYVEASKKIIAARD